MSIDCSYLGEIYSFLETRKDILQHDSLRALPNLCIGYSDREANKGQNTIQIGRGDFLFLAEVLAIFGPGHVLELGSGYLNPSMFIWLYCTAHEIPFTTVDMELKEGLGSRFFAKLPSELRPAVIKMKLDGSWGTSPELGPLIKGAQKLLVIVDSGDKPRDAVIAARSVASGSLVLVHDYGTEFSHEHSQDLIRLKSGRLIVSFLWEYAVWLKSVFRAFLVLR